MSRLTGLWRHADFRYLWAGHTVSLLGSQVTLLALPLIAILTLNATPVQMGALNATGGIAVLLFGLLAGVWVDRRRRRPLLIGADVGRALLLLAIPAAALFGALRIELLYGIAFAVGVLTLVFDVAAQSFLPTVIPRAQLVEGNSKLEVSRSVTAIVGSGLAGGLVQLVTAPFAILADALSFLASALLLRRIRIQESPPVSSGPDRRMWDELATGLRAIRADPILRAIVGATGLLAFFNSLLEAVFLLYLTQGLGFAPAFLGLIFGVGSVGFLLGALVTERVTRTLGVGRTLIFAVVTLGIADMVVPLVGGTQIVVGAALIAAEFFFGLGLTAYNITATSLRQSSAPDRLQGRVNAAVRLLTQGLTPLGAVIGGVLGRQAGLRAALFIAVAGELLAAVWLLLSPVRVLRTHPIPAEETP